MLGLWPLPSKLQREGAPIRERSISAGQSSSTALAVRPKPSSSPYGLSQRCPRRPLNLTRLEPRACSWSAVLAHKLGSNLGCAGINRHGAVKILGAKFRASGVPNAPPPRPQPSCPF